jgi:hypothetical protein
MISRREIALNTSPVFSKHENNMSVSIKGESFVDCVRPTVLIMIVLGAAESLEKTTSSEDLKIHSNYFSCNLTVRNKFKRPKHRREKIPKLMVEKSLVIMLKRDL